MARHLVSLAWTAGILVPQVAPYTAEVAAMLVERRLKGVGRQLARLRQELSISEEQLLQLNEESDDARLRSLVSETPLAEADARSAERTAAAMQRHQTELVAAIARLEAEQDELLDKLAARHRS